MDQHDGVDGPDEAERERRHRLDNLIAVVHLQTQLLQQIDAKMANRPTKSEVRAASLGRVLLLLAAIVAGMWAHDLHVEHCSPGKKAERIIQAVREGRVRSNADFVREANADLGGHCDVLSPTHTHDDRDRWPTDMNLVGLGLHGLLGLVGWLWWELARRRSV
jgi:hypothetical protein